MRVLVNKEVNGTNMNGTTRRAFNQSNILPLPLMRNRKPISKDATDDQCHFQIQQLAKSCFYHSSPELQQKETGSNLQKDTERKLSMATRKY